MNIQNTAGETAKELLNGLKDGYDLYKYENILLIVPEGTTKGETLAGWECVSGLLPNGQEVCREIDPEYPDVELIKKDEDFIKLVETGEYTLEIIKGGWLKRYYFN